MLALLAALIPIVGSLYAGATFLYDAAKADHELRVRYRISPLVEEHMEREEERRRARGRVDGRDRDALAAERKRFQNLLLRANGVSTTSFNYRDHEVSVLMSMPLVPPRERRRQTVVIWTAIAGVIVLAIDASTAGA